MAQILDSGTRQKFASGMVRDTTTGKVDWSLVADGPMLERWATHMTAGASKYAARNWMRAAGMDEWCRFRESAFRHFMQWYYGHTDEDHASAVFFNINGKEYVEDQMSLLRGPASEGAATPDVDVVPELRQQTLFDTRPYAQTRSSGTTEPTRPEVDGLGRFPREYRASGGL